MGFFCTPARKGGSQKQAPLPLTWKTWINGTETVRKGDVCANGERDREWSCRCLCTSKKVEGEKE